MRLNDFNDHSSKDPVEEVFQPTMKHNFHLADIIGNSNDFILSEALMEAELGAVKAGPILIKAKHDKNWVSYIDKNSKQRYMQVHDVRQDRDAFHRWAIYGVDENQMPMRLSYDLRPGREHSDNFGDVRELQFGEVIQLARNGVIKGEGGTPISTLDGLMQIADEPWRKLLLQKSRDAAMNGISLADIEKQIFAEPRASSAQRRTEPGTRSAWASRSMS